MNDKTKSDLEIMQYNFLHDDTNKVLRYLNNLADVKTRRKSFRFDLLKNNGEQKYAMQEINNTNCSRNNTSFQGNININFNTDVNVNNGINKYFKGNNNQISFLN